MDGIGNIAPSPINMAGAQMEVGYKENRPTLTDNLKARQIALQAQLDRVNAALAALEANPTIEQTLNLIQMASY